MSWPILSDSADLAVELARLAHLLDLAVEPRVENDWLAAAETALASSSIALALHGPPRLDELVMLAQRAAEKSHRLLLAVVGPGAHHPMLHAVSDLGVVAVHELRPLMTLVALHQAGAQQPWAARLRSLPAADKARLKPALATSQGDAGEIMRCHDGLLGWSAPAATTVHKLGELPDVRDALSAWRATGAATGRMVSTVEGVDRQAVLEVILGPRRALSDPASKTALMPYGVPLPVEELCASASRAAAEAARMGFPVRLTLTSPDLRTWDHADLTLDMVESAAAVRDGYRSLMLAAQARSPEARLLGITVTATSHTQALLRASLEPLAPDTVAVTLGFADPHGLAAEDLTCLVLPGPLPRLERALERLAGHSLVLHGGPAQRRRHVEAIGDVLLRAAAFVHDHREAIEGIELRPLALLVDGSVEVREACITVGDAFERTLAGQLAPWEEASATDQQTP